MVEISSARVTKLLGLWVCSSARYRPPGSSSSYLHFLSVLPNELALLPTWPRGATAEIRSEVAGKITVALFQQFWFPDLSQAGKEVGLVTEEQDHAAEKDGEGGELFTLS